MARKPRKPRLEKSPKAPRTPAAVPTETAEARVARQAAIRRRRNKRLLVIGGIALTFPLFELVAFQFRTITISVENQTGNVIKDVRVTYSGGDFSSPEIKPGGSLTRVVRPEFSFKSGEFSTYRLTLQVRSIENGLFRQFSRVSTLDYSGSEIYRVSTEPEGGQLQIKHATLPGFPLGTIRTLLQRMGVG
jgi:hypothetical protein